MTAIGLHYVTIWNDLMYFYYLNTQWRIRIPPIEGAPERLGSVSFFSQMIILF